MFVRLLVTSFLIILVVQSTLVNSSKGQNVENFKIEKHDPQDYDYDPSEQKLPGNNIEGEGSGDGESPDEYPDDEEEEKLSRVTARISQTATTSTTLTTTVTTTITTTATMRTTRRTMTTTFITTTATVTTSTTTTTTTMKKTPLTTTTPSIPWTRSTFNYEARGGKIRITTTLSTFNDLDGNEFKDDQEEYPDDLEDENDYNELALTTKTSTTQPSTTRYISSTIRHVSVTNHTAPIWVLFKFLARPPIARGILVGLAIGIFTSILLLICIIQRYHKRDKSHSSYTTGLLYPNHYGYSKSPQEFYA